MARRTHQILAWSLAGLLSLAVLAVGGGLAVLASGWARDKALAWLQDTLRRQAGVELSIGAASGNLLHTLRLENLRLSWKGRTPLAVRVMEISYNPLALLGGRLRVSRLLLVEPRVSLPLRWPASGAPGVLPAISIARVEVRGGSLLAPPAWKPLRRFTAITLTGRFRLDRRGLACAAHIGRARLYLAGARRPLTLAARARLERERLQVEKLTLSAGPNRLQARGGLELGPAHTFQAEVELHLAAAKDLPWPWPGPRPPAAEMNARLHLEGTPRLCRLRGEVAGGGGRLSLEARLEPRRLAGQAALRLQGVDTRLWGITQEALQTSGRLSLRSGGDPRRPDTPLELRAELSSLAARGVRARTARLELSRRKGVWRVAGLDLRGPWGELSGRGRLETATGQLEGRLRFQSLRLPATLAGAVPAWLREVALEGSARLQGRRDDLELSLDLSLAQARGHMDLQAVEMRWDLELASLGRLQEALSAAGLQAPGMGGRLTAGGVISGSWPAPGVEASLRVEGLEAPGLHAQWAELELALSHLAAGGTGRLNLRLAELELGDTTWKEIALKAQATAAGATAHLQATGWEGGWRVEGRLTCPDPWAGTRHMTLEGLHLSARGRGDWRQTGIATLRVGPEGMELEDLNLAAGAQEVSLTGLWRAGGEVAAAIGAAGLRLKPWLPDSPLPPQAVLDGRARLQGTLAAPRMRLWLRVEGLRWAGLPTSLVRLRGSYQQGVLRLWGRASTRGTAYLDLSLRSGVELSLYPPRLSPAAAGLEAQARFHRLPLALLEPVLPGVGGLKGWVDLQLSARGTLARPRLRGSLRLRDGAFTLLATGQRFRRLEAELELRDQRLRLQRAELEGGRLRLGGWVELPGMKPGRLELSLQARELAVSLGPWGRARVSARITARGSLAAPVIRGRVVPHYLEVLAGVTTPPDLKEVVVLKPGQRPPPLAAVSRPRRWRPGGWVDRARVEVVADLSRGLKVHLEDGWMQVRGEVRAVKAPGGVFSYHGRIVVERGLLLLHARRFLIQGGWLDFGGRTTLDPTLYGTATLQMGPNLVTVTVTGTARHPRLSLSSEPPMSQADILSTIIFGRPAAALDREQSSRLSAQALALLGQEGARQIAAVLGPALAPDVVTVHDEMGGGASLEAGKYLSPNLYLRYRHGLEEDSGQSVGLEYRFSDHFSLESQYGSTRDSGVDLLFSLDFD